MIPLWPSTTASIKRAIQDDIPEWSAVAIEYYSRYLGFMLGPEKAEESWTAALDKFMSRATSWCQLKAGMHSSTLAYNTFVFSVLGFVAQLERVPSRAFLEEQRALRMMAP
eukprot:4438100-Karenia_brevis.AAC.1